LFRKSWESYLKGVMGLLSMDATDTAKTRTRRKYDLNIADYVSHLNQWIEGISAVWGHIIVSSSGEKMDCVSIDSIASLPEDYHVDIVPKQSNKGYYLDFILYIPGKGEDKFKFNGKGPGRANVEFGNNTRKSIYDILMDEKGMEDLTFKPLQFETKRWLDIDSMADDLATRDEKLKNRYKENEDKLWLYYISNLGGEPAFIVHVPMDPYQAIPLINKWFASMKQLEPSNE
jgi:hypothetical protein